MFSNENIDVPPSVPAKVTKTCTMRKDASLAEGTPVTFTCTYVSDTTSTLANPKIPVPLVLGR